MIGSGHRFGRGRAGPGLHRVGSGCRGRRRRRRGVHRRGVGHVGTSNDRTGRGQASGPMGGARRLIAPPTDRRSAAGVAAMAVALVLVGVLPVIESGPADATAAESATVAPALNVTPSSGLVDNQTVSVVATGASPGTTYVAAECDPTAFTLLGRGASPADGCEARHNSVITVDAGGVAATTLQPQAVLTTSLGSSDCRVVQCFVAVEALHSTGGPSILVQNITFATGACDRRGSCTPPHDAWDPSLGGTASAGTASAGTASAGAASATGRAPSRSAVAGHPVSLTVTAGLAGDLTTGDAVTGPYGGAFPAPEVPAAPEQGEGLLRLALSAPHTSWGNLHPSSVVVDATLTDLTTSTNLGTQQFVLFAGSSPFVYAGFTGPVTTADRYEVTVAAEPAHPRGGESWPTGPSAPRVLVADRQLEVVAPANPQYLATAYAPVMFGRSTSALHDVPLLVDATATPAGGGTTQLSYTFIWSHEDSRYRLRPLPRVGHLGADDRHRERHRLHRCRGRLHVGGHLPMGRRARHRIPGQPGRAPGGGRAVHRGVGRPSPDPAGRHRQQRLLGGRHHAVPVPAGAGTRPRPRADPGVGDGRPPLHLPGLGSGGGPLVRGRLDRPPLPRARGRPAVRHHRPRRLRVRSFVARRRTPAVG